MPDASKVSDWVKVVLGIAAWSLGVFFALNSNVRFGGTSIDPEGLTYAGLAIVVAVPLVWKWLDQAHELVKMREKADETKQANDADVRRLNALASLAKACARSSGTTEIKELVHDIYFLKQS